jgi:DinB superfamily
MDTFWRETLWRQFNAAIDMLENAIRTCPDELWSEHLWREQPQPSGLSQFWYVAYHTLFWLDLYLSGAVEGFAPPAPFTLDELDPAGLLPPRTYTKDELRVYLDHDREKCQATIQALTDEKARRRCKFSWGEVSFLELLLDNMRHVQEHGAQLNMFLGQKIGSDPGWASGSKSQLDGT